MSKDSPTKVERSARPPARERPRTPFREVLKAPAKKQVARPVLKPGPLAAAALSRPVLARQDWASTENLGLARASMSARAENQVQARGHAQTTQEQKVDHRLLDLIVKELSVEWSQDPGSPSDRRPAEASRAGASDPGPQPSQPQRTPEGPAGQPGGTTGQAKDAVQGLVRAQAAAALVERIEVLVRSQRPALALTVGGGIDARVEVERTGKNQVALKVTGRKGPPAPDDLARIREELKSRGIGLSHLSVG